MTSLENAVSQLEAYLLEECSAQQRVEACLRRQEEALLRGTPADVVESVRALETELATAGKRTARRQLVLRRLGAAWRVSGRSLTLSSIVERLGPAGGRVAALRGELRRALASVTKHGRRVAAQARYQHKLIGELVQGVLVEHCGADGTRRGGLVDAEA